MKKKTLAYGFSIIIILIIMIFAALTVNSILTAASAGLERIQKRYIDLLRDAAGLDISYTALSPSVLAGIRMSNIKVIDVQGGYTVLTIDSIRLKWNLFKLLFYNPEKALGELLISGIKANYDDLNQYQFQKKIADLVRSLQKADKTIEGPIENHLSADSPFQSLVRTLFSMPINVRIKNFLVSYANANIKTSLFLSDVKFRRQEQTGCLNIETSGKTSLAFLKGELAELGTAALGFNFQGSLSTAVENSFAQLRFFSQRESDYTIPRLDMYLTYAGKSFNASLMQNAQPFTLSLRIDEPFDGMEIEFKADKLEPLQLLKIKKENAVLKKLAGTAVSGRYKAVLNWKKPAFSYDIKGSIFIPPSFNGGIKADYNFRGDSAFATIEALTIDSPRIFMQYEGSIDLKKLLPQGFARIRASPIAGGNPLSAEIYIDSHGDQVLFFTPQLYFGEKTITALQLTLIRNKHSIDFFFEGSDYSHTEQPEPGIIKANGSFLLDANKFLQLQLSAENLFLDSLMNMALWCLPPEQANPFLNMVPVFSPYIFSFDLFFSTNFKTITYYTPYAVIANTKKDNEMVLFSVDGNESIFQLSRFDMLLGGQSIQAELNADLGSGNAEKFFSLSLFFNSLPYVFSGVFVPNKYLNISGDYDFSLTASFLDDKMINGTLGALSFPVSIKNLFFSLSADTTFTFNSPQDWNMQVNRFEISESSGTLPVSPRLAVTGRADPYGVFFEKTVYSDQLSTLEGILSVSWKFENGVPKDLTLRANLADSFSSEKHSLLFESHNPNLYNFRDSEFLKNVYFSAEANIHAMPFARFLYLQKDYNKLNAEISALGTFDNPSIRLKIDDSSAAVGPSDIRFRGLANLEDKFISLSNVNVQQRGNSIKDLQGNFSLEDLSGSLNAQVEARLAYRGAFINKTFSSPIFASIVPLADNAALPLDKKSFKADVVFQELSGSFFDTIKNYRFNIERVPGRTDFRGGKNGELHGYFLDYGELSLTAGEGFPVLFSAYGLIQNNQIALAIENIYADAKTFSRLVDLPEFSLYSGIAVGSGTLTGSTADPQITADLFGTDMAVGVPAYVGEKLVCKDFRVNVRQNIFSAADSLFIAEKTGARVKLTADIALEKLLFSYLSINVKTIDNTRAAGKYSFPAGTFTGTAATDLYIMLDNEMVEVRGTIDTYNAEAVIAINTESAPVKEIEIDSVIDLTITAGGKPQLFIPSKRNPLIRGLVNQQAPLLIQIDTRYGTSSFTGDFTMRGGEILYLNRTFYAKEARAVINETLESFDPHITARAEIRERDKTGDPVRIMLTVIDQPLSRLKPVFTSVPVKSEQEIMVLLGQIAIADAVNTNPLALLGGLADYGAQITLFRTLENRLRDFFKFDIFSLRTMFLQNALVEAMNYGSGRKQFAAGNFLDNTTVYIGKYLGEIIYIDAMLHVMYDEKRKKSDGTTGALVFQPEFGLELPTPFANIRWSIAPDFTPDWKLLVPYTSISLSWKFNL